MIKQILSTACVFLIGATFTFGQNGIAEIYFHDGTTKKGAIEYATWKKSGDIVFVKGNNKTYSAAEISYFIADHRRYKSIDLLKANGVNDTNSANQFLPVQIIIDGTIQLLKSYNDELYLEKNGEVFLLQKEVILNKLAPLYREVLEKAMADCTKVNSLEIVETKFDIKKLQILIEKYNNNCGRQTYVASQKGSLSYGPLVAYQSCHFEMNGVRVFRLQDKVFDQNYGFGLFADYRLSQRKLSGGFGTQAIYHKLQFSQDRFVEYPFDMGHEDHSTWLDLHLLNVSLNYFLDYALNDSKSTGIIARAGLELNHILDFEGRSSVTKQFSIFDPESYTVVYSKASVPKDERRNNTINLTGSLTYYYKFLQLELSYRRTDAGLLNFKATTFYIYSIGLKFNVASLLK